MQKPLISRRFGLSLGAFAVRLRNSSLLPRPIVFTLKNQTRTSPEKSFVPNAKPKRCETALLNRLKSVRKCRNQIFWKCPKMLRNALA